jgi:hypothetical protein
MDRNPKVLYKGLVVGIIVLFIGLAVQPAIAQPEIIDFKPKNIDMEELTAKINEKFTTDNNWTFPFLKIFLYIIFIYLVCVPLEILFVIYLVIVKILSGY